MAASRPARRTWMGILPGFTMDIFRYSVPRSTANRAPEATPEVRARLMTRRAQLGDMLFYCHSSVAGSASQKREALQGGLLD